MKDYLNVIFVNKNQGIEMDIEIPVYITADELIKSLDIAFGLNIDAEDVETYYLRTENPIALLRGDKLLADYHLRTGTRIYFG